MTIAKKRKLIFADISNNYEEFLRQAKIKLNRKFAPGETAHIELVSDVLYRIVDKFDDEEAVDKYYELYESGMLFNYIAKAINTNCKSLNAPFLYQKLKIRNRLVIFENYDYGYNEEEEETKQDKIAKKILTSFEKENAPDIYGPEWRYYTTIYKEYINDPDATYDSIAKKYKIPRGSLARDMIIMKNKILDYLRYEKFI